MPTNFSPSGRRLPLVTSLLALSFLALAAVTPAAPLAPQIDFENPALPAKQKELLSQYAKQIVGWSSTASLVRAAEEQSAKPQSMDRILEIDRAWQAGGDPQGLATKLQVNGCAQALLSLLKSSRGFGEAFVTDSRGALVCTTRRTSDYWQGDEAKWTRAWAAGNGAVFVSEVAHDDSTGMNLMHISVPIRAEGKLVGVLTVGRLLGAEARRGQ